MTEIERKALALLQDCGFHGGYIDRKWNENYEALCRAIEQHEAFRQEVSDAVEAYQGHKSPWPDNSLRRFILPKPVDPLTECFVEAFKGSRVGELDGYWTIESRLRAALAARGLKIVEVE